jgi:hypothetical protein
MKSIMKLLLPLLGVATLLLSAAGQSAGGGSFFGDDDITSLPKPWKGPQVSGGSGSGEGEKEKVGDATWLKAGESWRGFVDVHNKDGSQGKVKVQPMKTGGSVTGKSGASFEVGKLSAGEVVNVGPSGHADVSGTGGTVNLSGSSSTTVTNTGGPGSSNITVNHPGGGHTDIAPGQGPITVYG